MRSRIVVRLAPTDRISDSRPGSAASSPASIDSVTGKKAITRISPTFGARS